jgi:RNA polymerase sigma-70 factor (ECF subfamily)
MDKRAWSRGKGRNHVHKQKLHAAPLAASTRYETALRECAAGRVSGISGIYANEAAQMRAVAWRIVRDRDYADDVIHEAFAQILRDAKHFDPSRGSARAWIYTIVRNTALKLRLRRSAEVAVGEEGLQSLQDESLQVMDAASRVVESVDLRACLEQLDPRRRASLILAIIDGHSHVDIATYLGVPVGTVKAWIRRELIALRKRLG